MPLSILGKKQKQCRSAHFQAQHGTIKKTLAIRSLRRPGIGLVSQVNIIANTTILPVLEYSSI